MTMSRVIEIEYDTPRQCADLSFGFSDLPLEPKVWNAQASPLPIQCHL